ncbi:MAG: hypothetical protein KY432_12365 [Acidobacteria bacterium]|nr:hypothetical protein [Acidobacteriota bacterium]
MSRKKNIAFATLVILTLAAVTPTLLASQTGRERPELFAALLELRQLGQTLDLSEDQILRIRAIVKETREHNRTYRLELRANLREAATHMLRDPGDTEGTQRILNRNIVALHVMRSNGLDAASAAADVLSAEQRTRLIDWIESKDEQR